MKLITQVSRILTKSLNLFSKNNKNSSKTNIEKNKRKAFASVIVIPVFVSLTYFYFIGRSRYFVRSDVIVRKASSDTTNSLSIANIIGAGNQSSLEDALFLQTYLESPQVLNDLEKKINFNLAYAKKGLDFYAGLSKNPTKEKKYNLFRKQVSMTLNERSGILRIRSLAFDPHTAYDFNLFLIRQAENFVNELNQSIYKEQLNFLETQVSANAEKLKIANKNLANFQKLYKILDVQSEANLSTSFISQLESQLVSLKVELSSIQRRFIDDNSPEIRILKDQIIELRDQIAIERNLLVNPTGKDFSKRIIEMEQLKNRVQYASDLYIASIKAAEKAKVDSIQQQRFLAIISSPQLPQEQWQYWRHRGFFTTFAIILICISVTKFLLGMAESHNN